MEIENLDITKLIEDPNNARTHSPKNLKAILGSLAKFGQQKPIVVDYNNIVIAGNGTLRAALELGWTNINVVRTRLEGYAATAFALADNRTGELAEWDDSILDATLKSLMDIDDLDLDSLGFDIPELKPVEPKKEKVDSFDQKCPKCDFEWSNKKAIKIN